jgi:hypothetical protein
MLQMAEEFQLRTFVSAYSIYIGERGQLTGQPFAMFFFFKKTSDANK